MRRDPEGKLKFLNLVSQGTLGADGQAYLKATVDIVVKELKDNHRELESLTVEVLPPSEISASLRGLRHCFWSPVPKGSNRGPSERESSTLDRKAGGRDETPDTEDC
jgi:hypothetical protein